MKTNHFFKTEVQRNNNLLSLLLSFFTWCSSYPKLLLEVFIRKRFGERYFRLSSSLTLAALLAIYPVLAYMSDKMSRYAGMFAGTANEPSEPSMLAYITWYIFIALFVLKSVEHYKAKKRTSGTYDFQLYSRYSGDIYPTFWNIKLPNGKTPNLRQIECYLEPLFFLILGLFLSLIGQKLGGLLIVASIFYSMNYIAEYRRGDNYILDLIDLIICNRNLERVFMNDDDAAEAEGFIFRGRKPAGDDLRRKIVDLMFEDDDDDAQAVA